jgi:hypothetical protein
LKDSAGRSFIYTPKQICAAALFVNMKGINHTWDKDKICAGKDWFSGFLKRNNIALREPECLSSAKAQLNQKAVADSFICTEICVGTQHP